MTIRLENATYVHAKMACYRCLNPENGVDLEVPIEGEGSLFLCKNCIGELAESCGFDLHAADKLDAVQEKLLLERDSHSKTKDQLSKARARARTAESK